MFFPAEEIFTLMNEFGGKHKPFLFGIDFEVKQGFFIEPEKALEAGILFNINGIGNDPLPGNQFKQVKLNKFPVDQKLYNEAFRIIHRNLVAGNSYLANLTFPTEAELNLTLPEIFARSKARYRLLFKDQFVVFSPEIFVRIKDGKISSFPMKGTIDASLPRAETLILNDKKETAEHNTIVDLIRNDLSMVANDVQVDRFRYIEKIVTNHKSLLQVSSEISGKLPHGYQALLGNIFKTILPAGSISGAPKAKTLQIIHEAETYSRGFYTGIFGLYNGHALDSGVMIRFIRNDNGKMTFCSGGGITILSNPATEYQELIDKVYVPII
jgi:para-aminobenzoate synthetase component I